MAAAAAVKDQAPKKPIYNPVAGKMIEDTGANLVLDRKLIGGGAKLIGGALLAIGGVICIVTFTAMDAREVDQSEGANAVTIAGLTVTRKDESEFHGSFRSVDHIIHASASNTSFFARTHDVSTTRPFIISVKEERVDKSSVPVLVLQLMEHVFIRVHSANNRSVALRVPPGEQWQSIAKSATIEQMYTEDLRILSDVEAANRQPCVHRCIGRTLQSSRRSSERIREHDLHHGFGAQHHWRGISTHAFAILACNVHIQDVGLRTERRRTCHQA
jgi:hypothetical protein